uniref:Uncharacterized protein n=1 Tax=Anguilla anguilla TaxID=7936 RepID=A0A0E9WDQ4_ANGAN
MFTKKIALFFIVCFFVLSFPE